jgi:DNA polymerase III alpha subunit
MRIISRATGMTLAEADILRREIKNGDTTEQEMERKFMFLAESIGVGRERAGDAWNQVRRFAAYSFCKAHAASYGVLAYASAYLKAHFPLEFYAAALRNHAGMYPTWAHVNEARRLGIRLLLPSVNESEEDFSIEPGKGPESGAIRTGLGAIKHLSQATLKRIIAEREREPFGSLSDLLVRVPANKDEVAALVTCGAMDGIVADRCGALAGYMAFKGNVSTLGQPRLAFCCEDISLPTSAFKPLQMRRMEYGILGFSPLAHPLEFFGESDGEAPSGNGTGRIRGVLAAMRHFKSGGTDIYFLTLDNPGGLHECTLPKGALTTRLEMGRGYMVTGRAIRRYGVRNLKAGSITPLKERL